MSEEYNPQAQLIEEIERLEVDLKELLRKRDSADDAETRRVLQEQIDERQTNLRNLQSKLV